VAGLAVAGWGGKSGDATGLRFGLHCGATAGTRGAGRLFEFGDRTRRSVFSRLGCEESSKD